MGCDIPIFYVFVHNILFLLFFFYADNVVLNIILYLYHIKNQVYVEGENVTKYKYFFVNHYDQVVVTYTIHHSQNHEK